MTPDLHISGGDARLGTSRLVDAPDPLASRRAATPFEVDGAERGVGLLGGARIDPEYQDDEELMPDRDDSENLQNAEVAGPALTLDARQLEQVGGLFKLLSDKTRLAILQILCEGEMNVTALCRRLKLPQPTVSHHLGLLRMNRLIDNRRSGKQVFYTPHERVKPVMLPQGDDGKVKLDGTTREVGDHPTGLQIVDEGFAIQIITHRSGGHAIYPRLESPVMRTAQSVRR